MGNKAVTSIESAASRVAEEHHLSLVVLFGSRAHGTLHSESDADIAVLADHPLSRNEYAGIVSAFSRAMHLPSTRIDVAELLHAHPLLAYHALNKGALLYGNPALFHQRRMHALKRFMDHKKFIVLQDEYIQHKLYGNS